MCSNALVKPVLSAKDALQSNIRTGQTVMVGGFGRGGTPFTLIDQLAEMGRSISDLTLIKNDANEPRIGVDFLFSKGMVKKLITTHIGLNPDLIDRMNAKELEVEFYPQGIFAERIRAGGAGIPAFLTDIGIDTIVSEEKTKVSLKGKTYIMEEALVGDVALISADTVDHYGNCRWRGSNRNMNPVMMMACDAVLVEAETIVAPGDIAPDDVHMPGVNVSAIIQALPREHLTRGAKG